MFWMVKSDWDRPVAFSAQRVDLVNLSFHFYGMEHSSQD